MTSIQSFLIFTGQPKIHVSFLALATSFLTAMDPIRCLFVVPPQDKDHISSLRAGEHVSNIQRNHTA